MASSLPSISINDSPLIEYYYTEYTPTMPMLNVIPSLQSIAWGGDIMPNFISTATYDDEGREATIILPADDDSQATPSQIKVDDSGEEPLSLRVKKMIRNVRKERFARACTHLNRLYESGYSPVDILTALCDALQNYDMPDFLKLEFSKEAESVRTRIADAVDSYPLLCGLLAKVSPSSEIIIAKSKQNNHTPA